MIDIFSEDARRNPYPLYARLRAASPPRTLTAEWLMFTDEPRHAKMRTHIMRAFTPRPRRSIRDSEGGPTRSLR